MGIRRWYTPSNRIMPWAKMAKCLRRHLWPWIFYPSLGIVLGIIWLVGFGFSLKFSWTVGPIIAVFNNFAIAAIVGLAVVYGPQD